MNYIYEINCFYEFVELNRLPTDAQALWHVLMHINNKCAVLIDDEWFWRTEFTAPNSMLLSILPFNIKKLERMRNCLVQKKLIEYKKGKAGKCGAYKIIPFDDTLTEEEMEYEKFHIKVWKKEPHKLILRRS